MEVKAKKVQVCIFYDYQYDADVPIIPSEVDAVQIVVSEIIIGLQSKHGQALPYIDVLKCDTKHPQNQMVIARAGIPPGKFPAIQILAEYEDGSQANYVLWNKIGFSLTNKEQVQQYVEAVLYNARGRNTIVCEFFKAINMPYLCQYEKWLWLAGGVLAGQQAVETTDQIRKAIYTGTAGLGAYQFYRLGGVEDLKQIFKIKNK